MRRYGAIVRDPDVVRLGLRTGRAALDDLGLLLIQDGALPAVTTIVAGAPVRGSWWSHEQAHSIFDVLQELYDDAAVVKLIARKQTLVHRRLWPALVAVASGRSAWQVDGLSDDARAALAEIDASDAPIRADRLAATMSRKASDVVRELEVRLLVATTEVHTETGRHVKAAQTWTTWATASSVALATLPSAADGRRALEECVRRMDAARVARLLPWPVDSDDR